MSTTEEVIELVVGDIGDFAESALKQADGSAQNIAGYSFILRVSQPAGIITFTGSIVSAAAGTFNFNRDGTKFVKGRHAGEIEVTTDVADVFTAQNLNFLVTDQIA
jgi:hypothetical protein